MWKINTGKTGIDAVLKPYQLALIEYVIHCEKGVISSDAHANLEFQGHQISRASVINYLKKLASAGIIDASESTGKGGYRGVYAARLSFPEIIQKITQDILSSLRTAFPDSAYLSELEME